MVCRKSYCIEDLIAFAKDENRSFDISLRNYGNFLKSLITCIVKYGGANTESSDLIEEPDITIAIMYFHGDRM